MSRHVSETTLEAAALDWFELLGYTTLHRPGIARGEPAAERSGYAETVLRGRLHDALSQLNSRILGPTMEEALPKVVRAEKSSLGSSKAVQSSAFAG